MCGTARASLGSACENSTFSNSGEREQKERKQVSSFFSSVCKFRASFSPDPTWEGEACAVSRGGQEGGENDASPLGHGVCAPGEPPRPLGRTAALGLHLPLIALILCGFVFLYEGV